MLRALRVLRGEHICSEISLSGKRFDREGAHDGGAIIEDVE
jgi:hypothetical protein